jgi:integrase
MRSLLHSTFENEYDEDRFFGRNPCDWSEGSKLSRKLGAKPSSVPHAAPEFEDLQHIVAYILDSSRGRVPGYITTAEIADWSGVTDVGLRKRRDAGLLHPIKAPDRTWNTASYMYSIEEGRKLFKNQLKYPEPRLREREEAALIWDIVLFTAFTAVRPSMATFLRWRNIKEEEGYIEYLAASGDLPAEHKTGYDGVSIYIVVLTDNLRAIIERARQRHIRDRIEIKDDGYVFVHGHSYDGVDRWFSKPVAKNASNLALKRLAHKLDSVKKKVMVISGIRHTIAKWATGKHNVDTINLALGHIIEAIRQNKTNKHYFYDIDLLEERREMMMHWERTLLQLVAAPPRTEKVISIRGRSASA